ncbi:MAG: ATP-binding protein [Bacteroides sp.]
MPILKKEDVLPERPVIVVIYGTPGSGKSSMATTAKNPIMIDTDRGCDRACRRCDAIIANTWEDILADESSIKDYDTVIVDTAKSVLDDFLSIYECEKDYNLKKNKLKMYGAIGDDFKSFVNRRRAEGKDVVFVCHAKEDKKKDEIYTFPDVTGQSKDLLLRIADQVGYIQIVNGKRLISFEPTDLITGKNVARLPSTEIPDCNDPKFDTFMADIIASTKQAIRKHSIEQEEALSKVKEIKEIIANVDNPEKADAALIEIGVLTPIQMKPLKNMLFEKCTAANISYDKDSKKFKSNETNPSNPT